MSDQNTTKNSLINIELPESVDNVVKNLTDKPTATIGETISDCMYLVFGGISQKAALKRAKYAIELEHFKTELEDKLNAVPEDKRIEPNTQVICTALDNMRFCVEEEKLRDMFSSLIANSINSDKTNLVHPSYGEIIKQMTSLDASIFLWMSKQNLLPIMKIKCKSASGISERDLSKSLIWKDWGNVDKVVASLDNLQRLKLIDISFDSYYTDEKVYEYLKQCPHIAALIKMYESRINEGWEMSFSNGVIKITEFGNNFLIACS